MTFGKFAKLWQVILFTVSFQHLLVVSVMILTTVTNCHVLPEFQKKRRKKKKLFSKYFGNLEDFVHENSKIYIYRLIQQSLTIAYTFDKLAI